MMRFLITNRDFKYEVGSIGQVQFAYVMIDGVLVQVKPQDGIFIPDKIDMDELAIAKEIKSDIAQQGDE